MEDTRFGKTLLAFIFPIRGQGKKLGKASGQKGGRKDNAGPHSGAGGTSTTLGASIYGNLLNIPGHAGHVQELIERRRDIVLFAVPQILYLRPPNKGCPGLISGWRHERCWPFVSCQQPKSGYNCQEAGIAHVSHAW